VPLLAALLLLSDCGPSANTFAPQCPVPRRPADLAQLTLYRPGATGQDITEMVLQGSIVDISGTCQPGDDKGDRKTVQADTTVTFRFVRGPAMQGNQIDVPFSVAVAMGDDIRDEARYQMRVTFPSNIDTVTLASDPVHMVFPVTKTTNAASYTIWAFFQLTPQQVEYNRMRGQ
jgi:hypothetical protein